MSKFYVPNLFGDTVFPVFWDGRHWTRIDWEALHRKMYIESRIANSMYPGLKEYKENLVNILMENADNIVPQPLKDLMADVPNMSHDELMDRVEQLLSTEAE